MGNANKIFNVGIYLRLSNEDINKDKVSESIKNQRYLLLEEIKKRKDFLLVDEYIDENISGAGTYRPEFERLINDCKNGKINVVLCKSQSRFSRDMEIIEKYLHNKFIEWNVRFISLSDYADTGNMGNKKARQINGLVNEWYLEDVSNNIKSAFKAKMINGEYISPFAAFGYKIDSTNNNKLIIDEDASLIVKEIFLLYLKGMGFLGIAKYLNENNIPSPSYYKYLKGIKLNISSNKPRDKIKWNANSIKTILTNKIYLGHLIQGKRTTVSYKNHKIRKKDKNEWIMVLNTHDAIIDNRTFNEVQRIMESRTRITKKSKFVHIFSGCVFCSICGSLMKKKNSSKHVYLVCSNSQFGLCCNNKAIRYDLLESIILDELNKLVDDCFDINILMNIFGREDFDNKINLAMIDKNNINFEINKLKDYLKNLYEDKVNNIITLDQFIELISLYDKRKKLLYNKLNKINNNIDKIKNETNNIRKIFYKYNSLNKLNKSIIDSFIEKIYIGEVVDKTRYIKIKWHL